MKPPPRSNPRRPWSRPLIIALFLAIPLTAYFVTQHRLAYLAEQRRLVEWEAEQALERKLDTLVRLNFGRKVKLKEWLKEWNRQTGLRAETYDPGNNDATPGEELELWLDLPPQPARDALQAFCDQHWGHWAPMPDGRIAVSLERYHRSEDMPLETRLHALPESLASIERHELINLVQQCIDRDSWEDVGGRGKLEIAGGYLVVVTFPDLQCKIAGFLQSLGDAVAVTAGKASSGVILDEKILRPRPLVRDANHMSRLLDVLEQPITLDVVDLSFPEFASQLSQLIQYPVLLDHEHLAHRIDVREDRVTCQVRDMKLRHALELALRPINLCITPFANGRAIQLTSAEREWEHRVVMAYYVGDFVRFGHDIDFDPINNAVFSAVPDVQQQSGPSEGEFCENLLIHPVTLEKHWEIQDLLMSLRRVRSGVHGSQLTIGFDNTASERMLELYERPLELKYDQQTIPAIVSDIRRRSGLPIYVFNNDLWAAEARADLRLSSHLPARPLRENLAALLEPLGLSVQLHPQYMTVSPAYDADRWPFPMEVFDLRSLARRWPDTEQVLSQLLTPRGGNSPTTFDGLLIAERGYVLGVPDTDLAQFVIQAATSGEPRWPGVGLIDKSQWHRPIQSFDLHAINRERIAELLSKRVSLQVTNRPMGEILFSIAKEHNLPMAPLVIPEGGVSLDAVISYEGKNQSLGDVLQSLIGDSDVARWHVRHGALCVESVLVSELTRLAPLPNATNDTAHYLPRWYFVGDLLQPRGSLSAEELCDQLRFVDSERPDPKANIQILVDPYIHFNSLLVIQATPKQHTQVEQILKDLRQPTREVAP